LGAPLAAAALAAAALAWAPVAGQGSGAPAAAYAPIRSWDATQHGAAGVWRLDAAEDGSHLCTLAADGSLHLVDLPGGAAHMVAGADGDTGVVDVTCLPSRRVAVLGHAPSADPRAPRNGAIVRVLEADGRLVWETRLPDSGFDAGSHSVWSWPLALSRGPGGRNLYALDGAAPRVFRLAAGSGRIEAENAVAAPGSSPQPRAQLAFEALGDLAAGRDLAGGAEIAVLARLPGALRLLQTHASADRAATVLGTETLPSGALRMGRGPAGDLWVLLPAGEVLELRPDGAARRRWRAVGPGGELVRATDLAQLPDGTLFLADAERGRLLHYDPEAAAAPRAHQPACAFQPDKRAAPAQVWLGDAVTVTLSVHGQCPEPRGADMVLAIDSSWSRWDAVPLAQWDVASARALLGLLEPGAHHVAALQYAAGTRDLIAPTTDPAAVAAALDGVQPAPAPVGNDAGTALRRAREILAGLDGADAGRRRLVLVFGDFWQEPRTTLDTAAALQREGIEIGVVHAHRLAHANARAQDRRFAALIASDHGLLWGEAPAAPDWLAAAGRWRPADPARHLISSAVITDTVPANMRYLSWLSGPRPDWDAASRTLTWRPAEVGFAGLAVAYRLEPLAAGRWPTNVEARAVLTDGLGARGTLAFPVPTVLVRERPTAAATAPATPGSGATPSPSASAGPQPSPAPAFLPLLLAQRCARIGGADVALVIDASSSMAGRKLADAIAAARRFVGLMDLGSGADRVAIVRFDDAAQLLQPLTADVAAAGRALDAITSGSGTRIDLGLRRAGQALAAEDRPDDRGRHVVLLTDGRQSSAAGEELLAAAELRHAGIRVFAIGLGADADRAAIRAIAHHPDQAYFAPDSAQLARLYAAIASAIRCQPEPRWP